MRTPYFTTKFKRDVKRQNKRGKDLSTLSDLIDIICRDGDAPENYKPHYLVGNWIGYRECHIEPDWLLIYRVDEEAVTFHRTGTHSDLFR